MHWAHSFKTPTVAGRPFGHVPGGGQVRVFNDEARESCWSMAMDVADLAGV